MAQSLRGSGADSAVAGHRAAGIFESQLGAWRGEGVRLGRVLEALGDLRRAERRAATRTSVVNLVVVPTDAAEAERACAAMHELGGRHPGRIIVLLADDEAENGPPAGDGLDAEVVLHTQERPGHTLWSEDIRLWPRGAVKAHLDSLIEPLTLPDLPIAVWYVGHLPEAADPLLQAADSVVVDAKEAGGRAALEVVVGLARRRPVVDLCWIRLRPWRELLAALVEPPPLRPFLAGVRSVEVVGKPGSRHLMAGWLASRLGLDRSVFRLADARHVGVRVQAEQGGRGEGLGGTFSIWRTGDERTLQAKAELDDGQEWEDQLTLPDLSLPWSLGEALGHLEGHRAYGPALQAALGFAS